MTGKIQRIVLGEAGKNEIELNRCRLQTNTTTWVRVSKHIMNLHKTAMEYPEYHINLLVLFFFLKGFTEVTCFSHSVWSEAVSTSLSCEQRKSRKSCCDSVSMK